MNYLLPQAQEHFNYHGTVKIKISRFKNNLKILLQTHELFRPHGSPTSLRPWSLLSMRPALRLWPLNPPTESSCREVSVTKTVEASHYDTKGAMWSLPVSQTSLPSSQTNELPCLPHRLTHARFSAKGLIKLKSQETPQVAPYCMILFI